MIMRDNNATGDVQSFDGLCLEIRHDCIRLKTGRGRR